MPTQNAKNILQHLLLLRAGQISCQMYIRLQDNAVVNTELIDLLNNISGLSMPSLRAWLSDIRRECNCVNDNIKNSIGLSKIN